MKKNALLLIVLVVSFVSHAQSSLLTEMPVSIGTFNYFYLHPGLKVGVQWDWRKWEKEKERRKGTLVKKKSLFISPQIAYYTHSQNHTGFLLNVDFGYQRIKSTRGFYSAYSVGFGYLTRFNAGTTYEYHSNGELTQKRAAARGYFMPSLNMEFGQKINEKFGWFTKFSIATNLRYNTGFSFETFHEVGIKLNFGKILK